MAKVKPEVLGSGMAEKAGKALGGRAAQIDKAVSGPVDHAAHQHKAHPKMAPDAKVKHNARQSVEDWIESGR
jgi:hypothetical protein